MARRHRCFFRYFGTNIGPRRGIPTMR